MGLGGMPLSEKAELSSYIFAKTFALKTFGRYANFPNPNFQQCLHKYKKF